MNRIAKKVTTRGVAIACGALAALPAVAHHSSAMFDLSKELMVEGTVTEFSWKNPHSYLTVKTANGPLVLELGPPSTLNPLGLRRDAIHVGDKIKIRAAPPRRGTMALGRELIRPDGSTLPLMIGGSAKLPAPTAKAATIAGTWVPEGFFKFVGSRGSWSFTDKGRAAFQAADIKKSTQNECIPVGAPQVMMYPTANRIEVGKDEVKLHIDWMGAERVVYMDGRKPPVKPTMQGFSTGKWEGTTLVVDTSHFAEHREGLALGIPSGLGKHLVERFSLIDEGRHINYEFVLEDPEYLTAPVKQSLLWNYSPDLKPSGVKCDVKSASRYLKEE
ncbi:MAG TPA: DUF6152 family protein [Steroidobacteraceae bacterium]|nr:DUF6152 family protein [Steroidobacteraceae bacterium]